MMQPLHWRHNEHDGFIQAQIKENIKAPRHWPLCGEFTGDRWIPRTKGQWRRKRFHLMTSSYFKSAEPEPIKSKSIIYIYILISTCVYVYMIDMNLVSIVPVLPHEKCYARQITYDN